MVCFKSFVATILWYINKYTSYLLIHIYHIQILYIYNSLASGENHWNIRTGKTFGRKTCSSDEWSTVTPFSKKDEENWTSDLTLARCRAPYMSCVSNILFMLFFIIPIFLYIWHSSPRETRVSCDLNMSTSPPQKTVHIWRWKGVRALSRDQGGWKKQLVDFTGLSQAIYVFSSYLGITLTGCLVTWFGFGGFLILNFTSWAS